VCCKGKIKPERSTGEEKKKVATPVLSDMVNILLEFGITAAAFHCGKLNGADCCELIKLAKTVFEHFKACLPLPSKLSLEIIAL
jgi:hypothetical protein